MTSPESERQQQALEWARRIADPHFRAWDEHMLWLESDPLNANIFDRVSIAMETATDGLAPTGAVPLPPPLANDNDNDGVQRRRRLGIGISIGGAVAAGVAALLCWPQHPGDAAGRVIATAPGVSREVALSDGTKVMLNGGSRLRIADDRSVALVDGEGYFEVAHRAGHPFRLEVGSRVVEDVGTAFDVAIAPRSTRVSVREGAVAIDPATDNVRLVAGQEARIGIDGDILRTTVTRDDAIGGWRKGRLVYQGASWTEVVTDLARSLGVRITLAPGMEARRFTGVIMLDSDKPRTIRRLADVAGLAAIQEEHGWRLSPR